MVGGFVVIGLGVFGRTVAVTLARLGHQVLAVDRNGEEAQRVAGELDAVVSLDATDEAALQELGLEGVSCAVVAIGVEAMEASILVTALLKQMGVPRIVARALSDLHARVLLAVGAHEVVSPEVEMGQRLARRLAQPTVLERLELGEGAELAEVEAPASFVGRTLVELDVRRRFAVSVVALKRGGTVRATIDGSEQVAEGDVMVVIGTAEAVGRLAVVA